MDSSSLEVNTILSKITSCLNSFMKQFQKNPFEFLYEAEIQASLYSEVKMVIPEKLKFPLEMNESQKQAGMNTIETGIMRAEYPSGLKFDIGIIHPKSRRKRK